MAQQPRVTGEGGDGHEVVSEHAVVVHRLRLPAPPLRPVCFTI